MVSVRVEVQKYGFSHCKNLFLYHKVHKGTVTQLKTVHNARLPMTNTC